MKSSNPISSQCPLPDFDFEVVTLGHGSGGLLTQRLLNTGVFPMLKNEFLDVAHDGAFLDLTGKSAFSTDSFVISPIIFPGGNIGNLAINGTVNDLAMCGAVPRYLSLSFILEEGLMMTEFAQILGAIKQACLEAQVKVVTGDTKVVERGSGDKIFVNTTGIGTIHPNANIQISQIREGDVIIVSGNIATHGIAILSVRKGLEFESTLQSDSTNLNHLTKKLFDRFGTDIHFLRDPTRGGLSSSLNEIAQTCGMGIDLWQKEIPLSEEVEGACEMLGLDPLYVANEGIFLSIVHRDRAEEVLQVMRSDQKGSMACIIGKVTIDHPRQVVLQSAVGGRRLVTMLAGEQLPRIC